MTRSEDAASAKVKQEWDSASSKESPVDRSLESVILDPKVRRKVDLHILPFIAILYLCSFLDRGNIGNAKVAGMATDLHLTGIKYQLAAAVFFIPYSLMEVPCNLILKLTRPSIWIPSIMIAWGIVMLSMAFVKSFVGLLICRIFLGFTEAGLPPGVCYYVIIWYCKTDHARAIALYISTASTAGAFGGLLAYGIERMEGIGGLHGWSWIFLLEGLLTVVVAIGAFFFMPDYPDTSTFLKPEEKENLLECLKRDTALEPKQFEMKFVWDTLKNPMSWLQTAIYIGMLMPLYALSIFLPTIINALGYSAANAQLLTVPPYALATIFTIFLGHMSDRYKIRGPFIMLCSLMAIVGYAMLYATSPTSHPGVGYAGTFLATLGVFPTLPLMLAWGPGNSGGALHKAVIIGMQSGVGNLGGICSSFIYRTQDSPRYHLGHAIVIGFLCIAFLGSGLAMYLYDRMNKAKERQCIREGIDIDKRGEYAVSGIDSPLFRYSL